MNRIFAFLAVALIFAATPGVAVAQDAGAGRDALMKADYARARDILMPLADAGDSAAQYWVGVMYAQGLGVAQDCREAALRYAAAARQDHPQAAFGLGLMLYRGFATMQDDCPLGPDPAAAAPWLLRAAKRDMPMAQYLVGRMHRTGEGLARSSDDAFDWIGRAAAAGLGAARFDLALMYAEVGNRVDAHAWFAVLAAKGYPGAAANMARLAKNMNAAEIAEAQMRAESYGPVR
jgi:hypothetical protein